MIGGFFVWAGIEPAGLVAYAHDSFEKGTVAAHQDIMPSAYDLGVGLAR